ncbi:MAG: hypothetical protein QOJ81_2175 [Chloroflexota bacterium]|nr:hypothetical protein [Chloroflexota bacterium]
MRRVALAILSGLMIVALMAPTVLAARPATWFVAKSSAAEAGGALHLLAKAKHATRGMTFSASAVVHFASGDVTVDLSRRGKSFVAGGKVAVPADQPLGPVAVDVTITYDGLPNAVPTFDAQIVADTEDDEDE